MDQTVTPFTLCDFLGECAGDLQAGRLRPLRHYLQRYPGHVEAIAREYLALIDGHVSSVATLPRIGRYELLGELARGGQGRVHLARDPAVGRFAAIKILDLAGSTDAARRARFRREVAVAVQVDHPFLCHLFEADVDHEPPFAAMEFVPGKTLADVIAEPEGQAVRGPVAPRNAAERADSLRFFIKVARAMHAMHDAGIVHRDLKPANLMVTPDGDPRVLDFGLAAPVDAIGTITLTDALLGTLPYMAPEQLRADGHIDARTDVFALGVTMFEAFTRTRPFAGASPATRLEAITRGVPWMLMRRLPADLRAVLGRALAPERDDRYASGADLAFDLQCLLEHRPVRARPIGPVRAAARWCRRHPWVTTWLLAMVAGLGIATGQAFAAQDALAATRQLERGVLDAVRTLDPWVRPRGSATTAAFDTLRRASADAPGGTLVVARLLLCSGDAAGALRELQARSDDDPGLRAVRLAGLVLLQRTTEVRQSLPAATEDLAAVIDGVADIAGELYRNAAWEPLDRLIEGTLELLADPPLATHRLRWPLCAWELQAACVRRNHGRCAALWLRETTLSQRVGAGRHAGLEFREAFLRLGADCVLELTPVVVLRGLADATCAATAADGDLRALRLEALSLAIANVTDEAAIQRMLAIVDELTRRLGAAHPDVVEARWRCARLARGVQPELCRRLLRDAWAAAASWPDAIATTDAVAILQALVARDHGVHDADALGKDVATGLRARAARALVARCGPADPRVLETLFEPPLDTDSIPEATDWFRQAIEQIERDPARQKVRADCLLGLLRAACARHDSLQIETYALRLQQSATGSTLQLLDGHSALMSSASLQARYILALDWLGWHDQMGGPALAEAMITQADAWERRLGNHGLGKRFVSEMLSALGWACLERHWLDAAACVLERAAMLTAEALGSRHDDWLAAALTLPPWDPSVADLLRNLAVLARQRGDLDRACRLLQQLAHPPLSLTYLLRLKRIQVADIHEYARCLLARHDYPAAEAELQECLRRFIEGRSPAEKIAAVRADLIVLYELMGQPAKVDQQRELLRR
ncbi:MAG: serine/threonine protein kinase [Planctomycetes bacterium]|nr:serine/threonine protein kinase [Planctomycetota bacterium]